MKPPQEAELFEWLDALYASDEFMQFRLDETPGDTIAEQVAIAAVRHGNDAPLLALGHPISKDVLRAAQRRIELGKPRIGKRAPEADAVIATSELISARYETNQKNADGLALAYWQGRSKNFGELTADKVKRRRLYTR